MPANNETIVCTACPTCGGPAQAVDAGPLGTTYRHVDTHQPGTWEAWLQGALDSLAERVKRLESTPFIEGCVKEAKRERPSA